MEQQELYKNMQKEFGDRIAKVCTTLLEQGDEFYTLCLLFMGKEFPELSDLHPDKFTSIVDREIATVLFQLG